MLHTLIETLTAFTVRVLALSFVDKQTDKSKDEVPKQHHHFSRTGPDRSGHTCPNAAKVNSN